MPLEAPAAPLATTVPVAPAPAPSQQPAPPAAQPAARVTPGSKAWAEMTPEQRQDQVRGPPNPRSVGHSPARDQREAAAARAAGQPNPAATTDPQNPPPTLSAEKVKIGQYEVSESELAAMMTRQSAEDLRKAQVPPTPNDYKLELALGAKLPGGVEYKFDASNPGLAALKSWAHAKGFDQSTLSEILTIYATHEAQQNATLAESGRAEVAKLGANGTQRVDALSMWIRGEVGDADARPILATMVTDAHVRFYEKLQQRISSQGAAPFSQAHRAAPDTNRIPGFDNMSFAQQRHAQEQLAARRR